MKTYAPFVLATTALMSSYALFSCATMNESVQLGATIGGLTGAAAVYGGHATAGTLKQLLVFIVISETEAMNTNILGLKLFMQETDITQRAFTVSYLCNPMKARRNLEKRLFQIAESQEGLFTAQQAEEAGFIRTNHSYHVKKGDWIREERGIYRLALFPYSREQQRATYSLWSRNRAGEPQGVYSHETALTHYELSDVNPSKLHMTVPSSFRRNSPTPKIIVLHPGDLKASDIQEAPGYRVTTPLRTLEDIVTSGETSFEFVEQAMAQALARGLITRSKLIELITRLSENGRTSDIRELRALAKHFHRKSA